MTFSPRRNRGRFTAARNVAAVVAAGLAVGAAARAQAAPGAGSTGSADDAFTNHLALGLDVGTGSTITQFNLESGPSGVLFFTAVRADYDVKRNVAAELTLREWFLPGANHATILGAGARFEPKVVQFGRVFVDGTLGLASTSFAYALAYDVGGGFEFEIPDAAGLSLGPYLRFTQVVDPDRRTSVDGLAWSLGASLTYHFGRAATGASATPEERKQRSVIYHLTIPDTDHDGVADDDDQCRDVPAGKHPDPFRPGCPENDEDGDGIPDVDDQCPVTPPGPNPDPKRPGCPIVDTDGDGIPDADDACPTRAGAPSPDTTRNGCPDPQKPRPAAARPAPSPEEDLSMPKATKKRHARPPE